MSGWLGRLFGARTAVESQRKNPVLASVVQKSAEIYSQIPLRDFLSEEQRAEKARELYLLINRICNSKNPAVACREQYAGAMRQFAAYQVLMIRPAPEEDPSGLRGQPGISGALHEHLVALFEKNDDLRAARFGVSDGGGQTDLWALVQRQYWECYWLLETLNATRVELGDSVADKDWHKPFLHAACVDAEHTYRWNLEMPDAFGEDIARQATTAYSMFTDIVMSGEKDPATEFRSYYRDSGIPMPNFEGS